MRVNLQEQGVAQASINYVCFLHARFEALQAGFDLGDHTFFDDALGDQFPATAGKPRRHFAAFA